MILGGSICIPTILSILILFKAFMDSSGMRYIGDEPWLCRPVVWFNSIIGLGRLQQPKAPLYLGTCHEIKAEAITFIFIDSDHL